LYREQRARLRARFENQHARHHRVTGEVTVKNCSFAVTSCSRELSFACTSMTRIDEQKRVPVREDSESP